MATTMTVATTILEQLGGGRFVAMTGSKNFVGSADALSFRIGSGAKNGINAARIVLTPADDYTVTFLRIRGTKVVEVETREGIYCDQLQDVFTTATGFYTKL